MIKLTDASVQQGAVVIKGANAGVAAAAVLLAHFKGIQAILTLFIWDTWQFY